MKPGQVRITETIGVLFIFFVLIALGMIFYYQYQQYAFKEKEQALLQARAVETTLRALFLPELVCSRGEAESEEHCIDMLKAKSFNFEEFTDRKREYYFNLFSYATISLTTLYPAPKDAVILYDWPKENYKNKENTFFVVALRDETLAENGLPAYEFGYLQVEVYS